MTAPPDSVLYSFRRCPFAMRARLALAVSGTRFELREVRLAAKPAAMLAASPKATVPVLVLPGGRVIDQSLDIMRWALSRHDPQGWLERDDAALVAASDGRFKHDLDRYKYAAPDAPERFVHRERGLAFLQELDAAILAGDRLGGGRRGLTDAAIIPLVRQFAAVDRNWFDAQPLPHLQPWLDDYLQSELFASIMVRVPPWSPGDPVLAIGPRDVAALSRAC